ncbi:hypothetical protein CDAR_611011 [Caerostris darwini]|uniref:Uncharacterized protein n=1 Tax=Caerostris darwini TaxID=1538125 RepID=A0AAV4U4K6_9ARAC|nr:hypothetical protein CDAR_611011 [Caerostris darwini]
MPPRVRKRNDSVSLEGILRHLTMRKIVWDTSLTPPSTHTLFLSAGRDAPWRIFLPRLNCLEQQDIGVYLTVLFVIDSSHCRFVRRKIRNR